MPDTQTILANAPIAAYLAGDAKDKSVLFGGFGRLNPILPQQIYGLYFILNKIFTTNNEQNPSDTEYVGIVPCAEYLWEIMGKYGVQAQGISGSGGSAPTPTPVQGFPIYVTQSDFTTATFYPNTNIFGNNILIFWNEVNRYLLPSEFTINALGITITAVGFDATSGFDANLVIEKIYS